MPVSDQYKKNIEFILTWNKAEVAWLRGEKREDFDS